MLDPQPISDRKYSPGNAGFKIEAYKLLQGLALHPMFP